MLFTYAFVLFTCDFVGLSAKHPEFFQESYFEYQLEAERVACRKIHDCFRRSLHAVSHRSRFLFVAKIATTFRLDHSGGSNNNKEDKSQTNCVLWICCQQRLCANL